jgi:hypothetical protein
MPALDRKAVLDIFERHRASPGTPLDESHFLDFLAANPKGTGVIRNSFSGLRRYNAFIDDVQIQFNVCLSVKDFNANYSLAQFLARIGEFQRSPKGSITSLRNQTRRGFGWGTVTVGNFLAVCFLVAVLRVSPLIGYLTVPAIALANILLLRFFLRWRSYSRRLMAQLVHAAASDA